MKCFEVVAILMVFGVGALAAPQQLQRQEEEVFPPMPYAFDYTIRDEINAVLSARVEEGDADGVIRGSYTYVRPDGIIQTTNYVADKDGFRSEMKEEPAGGLEIPNPSGTIDVSVNLPYADQYGYSFTAEEYRNLHEKA